MDMLHKIYKLRYHFCATLKNHPFKHYICKHIIQVPIIDILLKSDNIQFPREIAAVIGQYLYDNAKNNKKKQ